ncbi:MAG: D-cysteine desulfhydrase family protein [Chloroflexi bacterium]|nr:D-cysteine desulfhydrase family protein [Chloroflexota bacterium]
MTERDLKLVLARVSRARLADLPTPLHDCPRLSAALAGPRILIKRDDLTGLALGGNKTRALEFVLGDAVGKGADTVITSAAVQSNQCRQAAAAGARLGLDVHLVLKASVHNDVQGNLLLDHLLGARVRLIHDGSKLGTYDMSAIHAEADRLADELRAQGRNPYIISMQTHSQPLAGAGYLNAMLEMEEQFAAMGVRPSHLVTTSGSGGTHSSLALAVKTLGLPYQVIGISIRKTRQEALLGVSSYANRTAELFGLPVRLTPDEVVVYDDYYGEGYALPTEAGLAAMKLVARTEGILLDPVYTGKAMSGIVGLIRRGILRPEHTVIFVHTGGIPALFAYNQELMAESTGAGSAGTGGVAP